MMSSGQADLMLVLKIDITGEWEEVYYGPFEPVRQASRYSARDNKQMIAVTLLRQLAKQHTAVLAAPATPEHIIAEPVELIA